MAKSAPAGDTTIDKEAIIKEFGLKDGDTGSSEVQIALLTARVRHLTEHLRVNRKDFHSRRGLIAMTARRRKLLDYVLSSIATPRSSKNLDYANNGLLFYNAGLHR